jgi:3-deoxy-D-manno-octulosonate 8-phosphate phosphatase (KDO 8-P phosphatase)
MDTAISARAQNIKLAIFDVDGVFTDGRIHMGVDGQEFKSFHTQDGLGIVLLRSIGLQIAVISGLRSDAVTKRMTHLGVQHIHLGHPHKIAVYEKLLIELQLSDRDVCYTGDDWPDLPLIQRCGLGIAVANAHPLLKTHAHWQTQAHGGNGAVREVCELLISAQGKLDEVLKPYDHSEKKSS